MENQGIIQLLVKLFSIIGGLFMIAKFLDFLIAAFSSKSTDEQPSEQANILF